MEIDKVLFVMLMALALFVGMGIGYFIHSIEVEGHTSFTRNFIDEFGEPYNQTYQKDDQHKTLHIVENILKEEKSQTALLDQISCYMFSKRNWNYLSGIGSEFPVASYSEDLASVCGKPLNYTGVWKP